MAYHLLQEHWIPWRRAKGDVEWGSPATLVSGIRDGNPIVALATPRPDFDGALTEFLIGLLTAALTPANENEWGTLYDNPPTVEALQARLDALPPAFDLEGETVAFLQDVTIADFTDAEPKPIDQLLIDSPGDQGVSLNKDLFVKRMRVDRLGRPAAAMALITMQTYAPAGGQGYRTSMRGGGPLTTLVDPRRDRTKDPLWRMLWANVETTQQLANRASGHSHSVPSDTYPWMAPTRTSNIKKGGRATPPKDAHPLQAYFGLPRRVRLEFGEAGTCGLTNTEDSHTIIGFRALNYGVQYDGWQHPLSPHYRTKLTEPWLPVHGQPGGLSWRDWLSITLKGEAAESRNPAGTVAHFQSNRASALGIREFSVRAFGYDMDNMKARGWTDIVMPALAIDDPARRAAVYDTARALVEATSIIGSALVLAVKTALFQSPDDAGGDLTPVKLALWDATEASFYVAIRTVATDTADPMTALERDDDVRRDFRRVLERDALTVFDRWCPTGSLDSKDWKRRIDGRRTLQLTVRGYTKLGEQMFEQLGIAPPGGGRAARANRTPKQQTRSKTP